MGIAELIVATTVNIALIGVVWWFLITKIDTGDKVNKDRIIEVEKHYGRHDSKINDFRGEHVELRTTIHERTGEINRRFEEFRGWMKDIDTKLEKLLDRRLEDRK